MKGTGCGGKLGLALVGKAMLSKPLIQFSVNGWGCVPSLKDFHDTDNYDGVITHLEPDILESEVKWASGIITMNKASGGNAIPAELFQILKDDAVKGLPKPLTVWITTNCGKFLKRWEYQAT